MAGRIKLNSVCKKTSQNPCGYLPSSCPNGPVISTSLLTSRTAHTLTEKSKRVKVIPENIRKRLNLKTGAQFVVLGEKDVVILKNISPPSIDDFDDLIGKARRSAKKAGLKRTDVKDAIAKVRGKK